MIKYQALQLVVLHNLFCAKFVLQMMRRYFIYINGTALVNGVKKIHTVTLTVNENVGQTAKTSVCTVTFQI